MDLRAHFWSATTSANGAAPQATPDATGSGPRGNFIGRNFRAAYAPGIGLNGSGQAVALFEFDSYYPGDVVRLTNAWRACQTSRSPMFTGRRVKGIIPAARNIEVSLDIDMAISMAPGLSRVIVYEGVGPLTDDILNRMATDNLANQLSSSWNFGRSKWMPLVTKFSSNLPPRASHVSRASGDIGAWGGAISPAMDDPLHDCRQAARL